MGAGQPLLLFYKVTFAALLHAEVSLPLLLQSNKGEPRSSKGSALGDAALQPKISQHLHAPSAALQVTHFVLTRAWGLEVLISSR